jgi:hypothetical protein
MSKMLIEDIWILVELDITELFFKSSLTFCGSMDPSDSAP